MTTTEQQTKKQHYVSFRCSNDMFLYCTDKDHINICQQFIIDHPNDFMYSSSVKCELKSDSCGYSKTNSEILKDEFPDIDERLKMLSAEYKKLKFSDMEIMSGNNPELKKDANRAKKKNKVKPAEVEQIGMF